MKAADKDHFLPRRRSGLPEWMCFSITSKESFAEHASDAIETKRHSNAKALQRSLSAEKA
jgi:hypothetical protein